MNHFLERSKHKHHLHTLILGCNQLVAVVEVVEEEVGAEEEHTHK